jgi:hypothetical protein
MAKFTNEEILKIISVLDTEADKLEDQKRKTISTFNYRSAQNGEGEDNTDYYAEERKRYDKEIELVRRIVEKYRNVINAVEYEFGKAEALEEDKVVSKVFKNG